MKSKKFIWAILLCLALVCLSQVNAQEVSYQPTRESIMQHATPDWFKEAKIGVFIHFIPSGVDAAIPEKFSADQWIELFEKAGAEYFVFTTKHNNGWCNWPSKISEHSAKEENGPRDLVTPLVESARKAGMKVGLYYNLMNRLKGVSPAMAQNPELEPSGEYVLDYLHPEIKELVSTYQPDLLWTDGDWISTSEYWHSNEIVAWLYNWAENENRELCLTDRWGRDIRICTTKETPEKYGDFWTLERRIMKDVVCTHPWESCLTLTESWTYRENEQFRVLVSELIGIMCDIVSKGGRFLINIGPARDGSIVEADRETLLGIGKWLDVNGEAIYGTKPMDCSQETQSGNEFDRAKDLLLPKTGINNFPNVWEQMLVQNRDQGPLRFTVKESYIYAIHQGWPGETLELNDLVIKPGSEIRMLGVKEPLLWKLQGNKIIIKLPSEKPCEHAFVLKMEKGEANTVDYVTKTGSKVDFGKTDASAYTPEIRANMKQLYEDKFGLFVHFGPYAKLAGIWDGKEIAAEWIMRRGFIPVKEYEKHAAGLFKPEKFNAKQWVDIAESAGMKFIVVTAKHHDGFAMYDSAHPYNLVDFAGFGRDILKELSVECAKRGMNLGFYYSQSQDWHEEGGVGNHWDFEGITKPQEQFDAYFEDKAVMQVKELTSNYGDIFMVWFDTPAQMDDQKCQQMMDIVRENQPGALVNSRLGQGYGHFDVSIDNGKTPSVSTATWLPDLKVPWQTHESVTQRGWGYTSYGGENDRSMNYTDFVYSLCRIVCYGGVYLLNVGPRPDGTIPESQVNSIRAIGKWLEVNGEAIYGADPSPLKFPPFAITSKPGKIYMHLKDLDQDQVELNGILSSVTKAYCLADRKQASLKVDQNGETLRVSIPEKLRQPRITVVVLDIADEKAKVVDETLQQEPDGVIKLPVAKCEFAVRRISYDYETQLTRRWGENTMQGLIWTVNVTAPGTFKVISEDTGNSEYIYELITADDSLSLDAKENVGRLTRKSHDGTIRIEKAGVQKIIVYPNNTVRRSNYRFKGLELIPAE